MASSNIIVLGQGIARPADQLTLIVNGSEVSGWEEVEVTLRAIAFPNSFSIRMSSRAPITSASVVAKAGDECLVLLGNDQVIDGYVDRDMPAGDHQGHSIQLVGRGKTQDLVDCSAEWPSGQIINGDALSIANQLALPYAISVNLGDGASAGPQVPQFLLDYGITAADIIQQVARNAGLLAYEDAHGSLVLATVGAVKAASGVAYGTNVQAWSVENSMDGRYSDYVCALLPSDIALDLTGPGDIFYHREKDPNVPRHRQLDFVLEAVASDENPGDFTIRRARWEAARRAGSAAVIHATVDSWRDSAGTLWAPNTLLPVSIPGNRAGDQLVLSTVTFRRTNETGTTAELELMPPSAFAIEPIALQPVPVDLKGPGQ